MQRHNRCFLTMKQLAQYQDGRLEIQEVPIPVAPPGGALVQVTHSVISIGTEKMKVEQAKMNLLQKAMARPDQVRKVMESVRNLGWKSALQKVRNRMESPTPLGYSAAGVVVAVDEGNTRLRVGERVACAGAECANHAEFIAMPDMLMAKIPDGVPNWMAAYSTVLSIALQALRQGDAKLGEQVVVMGQGLIGLLLTALLHANGVRVMAVDLMKSKEAFSVEMGAECFVSSNNLASEVRSWTSGYGVDKVYLCTGTKSNKPVEQAAEIMRDRGRLVIVGNTKTELSWKTYYEKELDVRYSRSYGPGRYDPSYEWGGSDYPIGYVRWTEQRNLDACLALMAAGKLNLEAITTHRVQFEDSLSIYQELLKPESQEIGVVLEYAVAAESVSENVTAKIGELEKQAPQSKLSAPVSQLHVIGAGNFARTMLLPHLRGNIPFGVVVNQTALSANHVKNKFGFQSASTEVGTLLKQGENAAVVIATRHHLHASLTLDALNAGLHVFVEKPLCLTREELLQIDAAVASDRGGSVQVGFNRRFAPLSVKLKEVVSGTPGPKSAVYRVMAGKLDPKHWYANFAESGGRILGEACHFFDYFCWLFSSKPVRLFAQTVWPSEGALPFPDSITAQVELADGSSGQLSYSAEGDNSYPKERLTVFGSGFVGELDNYQKLQIYRGRKCQITKGSSKGHAEQMARWLSFLKAESSQPLPYAESRQAMRLTFAALESIQQGRAVALD